MRPRGRGGDRPGRSGRATAPPARGNLGALRQRLTGVIEPVVRAAGFDVERVSVSRVGRRHSVKVVVDRDGGVGLDAIAEVSRTVSAALDAAEQDGVAALPGEYVLEVTSPGVDRPLTEARHWRRNIGRLVTVPGPGGVRLTGRIHSATAEAVVLELADGLRELVYADLGSGRVQVELRAGGDGDEPAEGEDGWDDGASGDEPVEGEDDEDGWDSGEYGDEPAEPELADLADEGYGGDDGESEGR